MILQLKSRLSVWNTHWWLERLQQRICNLLQIMQTSSRKQIIIFQEQFETSLRILVHFPNIYKSSELIRESLIWRNGAKIQHIIIGSNFKHWILQVCPKATLSKWILHLCGSFDTLSVLESIVTTVNPECLKSPWRRKLHTFYNLLSSTGYVQVQCFDTEKVLGGISL